MAEAPKFTDYRGNKEELDPDVFKALRLDRVGMDSEDLDVYQRMEKKGVPTAETISDIEAYLKKHKLSLEEAQRKVEENFRKYKIVENNLTSQRAKIKENEPEFEQGKILLKKMREAIEDPDYQWPMEVRYPLAEQVYSTAFIDKFTTINIVLGCQTMAEVTLDDGETMFIKNLNDIQKLASQLTEEINFVKDQVTTIEVVTAHLYNYAVKTKNVSQK